MQEHGSATAEASKGYKVKLAKVADDLHRAPNERDKLKDYSLLDVQKPPGET
jgi:hypothetical protein